LFRVHCAVLKVRAGASPGTHRCPVRDGVANRQYGAGRPRSEGVAVTAGSLRTQQRAWAPVSRLVRSVLPRQVY